MTLDPLRHLPGAGQRLLAAWAALGATVQACLPPLHGLDTAVGPVALWLWLLPTAALALAWLLAPAAAGNDRRDGRGRRPAAQRRRPMAAPARVATRNGRLRAPLRPVAGRRIDGAVIGARREAGTGDPRQRSLRAAGAPPARQADSG